MWFDLPKALRSHLLDDSDIADAVGERLHYQELPESSEYPHVWFTRTGMENTQCVGGDEESRIDRFAVEVVGDDDVEPLIDAIVTALQNFEGEVGQRYVQLVDVEDADDDYVFQSIGEGEPNYLHALTVAVYSFDS